jgi:hypothetical protein
LTARAAWKTGITTQFFILLPPGADSKSSFCGEHASTTPARRRLRNEVADICGGDFGRFKTTVPNANTVLNGRGYRLPAIYSVKAKACKPNF